MPLRDMADYAEDKPHMSVGAFLGTGLFIFVCGALSVWWIMSDYSGDYQGTSGDLGIINLVLTRHAAGVRGSIAIGHGGTLEVVDGQVRNGAQIELSFAPASPGQSPASATAHFKGAIDPPRVEGSTTDISFRQVLNPEQQGPEEKKQIAVPMPRVSLEDKVIKGVLTYQGQSFQVSLHRNPLTSLFQQVKSILPGAS